MPTTDTKLIIFDLDGTLVDAYTAIAASFNFVMRRLGLKPKSASTVKKLVGWGDVNLLKPHVAPRDLERAVSLYRAHHKQSLLKYSRLLPYAGAVLSNLRSKGYKLAIASNRPQKFSLILLKHLKIARLFDYVLCADQAAHGKPHPEMLERIIRHFGFTKGQAVFVGDMAIDAQAARNARIGSIMVTGGSSSKASIRQEKPGLIIPSLRALCRLF